MNKQCAVCDLHPVYPMAPILPASEPATLFRCTRFGCSRRYSESRGYFDLEAEGTVTPAAAGPRCNRHQDAPWMFVSEVAAGEYRYVCWNRGCAATTEYVLPIEFRKPVQRAFSHHSATAATRTRP